MGSGCSEHIFFAFATVSAPAIARRLGFLTRALSSCTSEASCCLGRIELLRLELLELNVNAGSDLDWLIFIILSHKAQIYVTF